jgi:hypothetical protein
MVILKRKIKNLIVWMTFQKCNNYIPKRFENRNIGGGMGWGVVQHI